MSFPRLTFPQLWVALAILLPVLAALLASMSTVDLAYQVQAGRLMLDQGTILRTDPFAFTTGGAAWLNQQWGAQILLGLGYRVGSWAGLAVLRAVLVALTMALVLIACRRQGAGLRVAAWLTIGSLVLAAVAMGLRPQLFGMVLFAATLAILAGRDRQPRAVWLIPLLVIPWASLHGSFVFAPAAVGIAGLEDELARRPGAHRLLLVAIAAALASLINPFGIGVWSYAIGLTTNATIRSLISEWQPTAPLSATGLLLYGSMIVFGAIIVVQARGRPWRDWLRESGPTVLWLVFLGVIAIQAQRGIAWWALAAPVAVAGVIGRASARSDVAGSGGQTPNRPQRASAINGAIVIVLAMVGVLLLLPLRGGSALMGPPGLLTDAPEGVTAALVGKVSSTDRIWNAQAWGSWFEFALPGVPVAVDSRIEVIPADAWADHVALSAGLSDWESILDRWEVSVVVASRTEQARLIPLMETSPRWIVLYEDIDGVIFGRR